MANNVFRPQFSGNVPTILARQMVWEALDKSPWGRLAGYTVPNRIAPRKGEFPTQVVNRPLVVHNELMAKQGDVIQVPLHRQYTGKPRYSGEQLVGFEERPKINHAQVAVDLTRHGSEPMDGSIMQQITKDYELIKRAKPGLQMHFGVQMEHLGILHAMYYGYSHNVINGHAFYGDSRFAKSSHPHIFVSGAGKVGYSGGYPGSVGYEQAVGAAVQGLGASDKFDTGFLNFLKNHPQVQRIKPITMKNGREYWLIIAHGWQINDLLADSAFKDIQARAMVQELAKDNPFIAGAEYCWNGFVIYEHSQSCWPVNVVGSNPYTPVYGPFVSGYNYDDPSADLSYFRNWGSYAGTPNTVFAALLLGDNALFKAQASDLQWRREEYDYGETLGVAYRVMDGYSRADFINNDDGTAGEFLVNDGSALIITKGTAPTP
jgi:hypothetical protein